MFNGEAHAVRGPSRVAEGWSRGVSVGVRHVHTTDREQLVFVRGKRFHADDPPTSHALRGTLPALACVADARVRAALTRRLASRSTGNAHLWRVVDGCDTPEPNGVCHAAWTAITACTKVVRRK